jgi:predicted transcriptional regulator of viral defense system
MALTLSTHTYDRLVEVAAAQHGMIRPADAEAAGVKPVYLRKLVTTGRAQHLARGLYRIVAIPPTPNDEFHEAVLWANGDGVIGGEAALALWDLADVNPRRIEVVLPPAYQLRRTQRAERYAILHRALEIEDIDYIDNIPVVRPGIAIAQAVKLGVDGGLIEQAIANARARFMIDALSEARLRVLLDNTIRGRR